MLPGALLTPNSPDYFSARYGFSFQRCLARASLLGCCRGGFVSPSARCLVTAGRGKRALLSMAGVCISHRRRPRPGSVCLSLGYRGVWATSPRAGLLASESRRGLKAEVGAELLTCMGGLAPAAFLGAMEHPRHRRRQLCHRSLPRRRLATRLQQLVPPRGLSAPSRRAGNSQLLLESTPQDGLNPPPSLRRRSCREQQITRTIPFPLFRSERTPPGWGEQVHNVPT